MRIITLCCGIDSSNELGLETTNEFYELPEVPSRKDLKLIDAAAAEILPVDPTPSLEEIQKRPDVEHLGTPTFAPQQPETPLRVIVIGTDASLSAVVTRLMRADNMWVEVGFVPTDSTSTAAANWGLSVSIQDAYSFAQTGRVNPAPLIRDDAGIAIAGSATITDWQDREITGEIIVDDHTLVHHQGGEKIPRVGVFGARLVPMTDAPGIAAAVANTPLHAAKSGFVEKLFGRSRPSGTVDAETLSTGRALQAGGLELRVEVDGVTRKKPAERVTFYRHLRDLQIVRP